MMRVLDWTVRHTSHITAFAVGVALVVAMSVAQAQYPRVDKSPWQDIATLDDDAINSAVWTGWLSAPEYRAVVFEVSYTQNAGTDVSMTCETADPDTAGAMPANGAGFELHKLQDSATAGTSDSYAHIWREPGGATGKWSWTVANLPHERINCSFVATGGDGDDKATVRWRAWRP